MSWDKNDKYIIGVTSIWSSSVECEGRRRMNPGSESQKNL